MKIKTINIINGKILGDDSITFNNRFEYEGYINALINYVADKELAVEFNHESFSPNETEINDAAVSLFCSDKFKSIIFDGCIAWKEGDVITINILEDTTLNIGSQAKTGSTPYLRRRKQEIK